MSPLALIQFVGAAGSLTVWVVVAQRLRQGAPLVPFEPRQPAPWGILEVLALVFLYFPVMSIALVSLGAEIKDFEQASSEQWVRYTLATALGNLAFVGLGAALLVAGRRAGPRDLGLPASAKVALGDVWLGIRGFFAALVPVFFIMYLAEQLLKYEHPVMKMLEEQRDPVSWSIAALAAVVAAPLAEEFFFRLVLQSWLEKLELELWVAELRANHEGETAATSDAPLDVSRMAPGIFPMFLSSFVWAMMHFEQGPAPVPLFILGLGLGYLFRETHRILPCFVLHMLFNAWSLGSLAVMQFLEAPVNTALGSP
jgi:membrane protease YdiL (CAAX protease family)